MPGSQVSIQNSIAGMYPGFGSPSVQVQKLDNELSTTGAVALAITISQPNSGLGVKKGWVRLRVYDAAGTSPTFSCTVSFTDGTTTVYVQGVVTSAVLAATDELDFLIPFNIEIAAVTCTVTTTLGGTSPLMDMDVEVFAGN